MEATARTEVITKTDVRGIMPPLYTPFTEEGDLDPAAFRREVQMMRELPITGVVVGGSTGEGHALSIDELAELCRIAIDEVGGSMPVIAGIITTTTRDAIARGRAAREAGVNGTMVTPPIYQTPDAAAMIDYYSLIRTQVGLPIIIYNVLPHAPVTPEITRWLAEQEVVIATKESAGGSLAALSEIIDTVGDRISVTWAQDHMLYPGFALGATGSISGTGAMFPRESIAMFEVVQRNDMEEARRIHYCLAPVTRAVMSGTNWPARVKAVATLQGRPVGPARRPFVPLSNDELAVLDEGLAVAEGALGGAGA